MVQCIRGDGYGAIAGAAAVGGILPDDCVADGGAHGMRNLGIGKAEVEEVEVD